MYRHVRYGTTVFVHAGAVLANEHGTARIFCGVESVVVRWKGHVVFEEVKLLRRDVGAVRCVRRVAPVVSLGWSRLWFDALLSDGVVWCGVRVCEGAVVG